jgi:hypothetical protein
LPKSVAGDVLVLVNVGGRDFNDNPTVMVSAPQTEAKVRQLRQNLAKTLKLLRDRYEVGGKKLLAVVGGIHDPTDGKGTVPKGFTKGFCKVLASPLVVPFASTIAASFAKMNATLQAEAAAQGALYVDLQAAFLGHGMNSGPERWIGDHCVHPTNPGHDLIRRKVWEQRTGKGCESELRPHHLDVRNLRLAVQRTDAAPTEACIPCLQVGLSAHDSRCIADDFGLHVAHQPGAHTAALQVRRHRHTPHLHRPLVGKNARRRDQPIRGPVIAKHMDALRIQAIDLGLGGDFLADHEHHVAQVQQRVQLVARQVGVRFVREPDVHQYSAWAAAASSG